MEKNGVKKVVFVLLAGLLLFGSCTARNEKRIVGTWTDREDNTWVFWADGKLVYENGSPNDLREYNYDVTETKLSFEIEYFHYIVQYTEIQTYDISFSSDGKTLILTGGKDIPSWSVAGPGWGENRLLRK